MSASGWTEKSLEDICTVKGGKRLPAGHSLQDEPTDHPYIKSRDIRGGKVSTAELQYLSDSTFDKIKRYIVNTNDVCITIVANIGDVGVVPRELDGANLTENAVKLTNLDEDVDPGFLGTLLSHPQYKAYMEQLSAGAAQAKLGIYKIRRIKVLLPPPATQRKIAAILTAYDDLIETNKRRIALLENMAEELYREWFVRMRFPGHQNTKFVKGVPEGWEIKRLGEILELAYGKALKESDREPGEFHVYGSGGIVGSHSKALVKNEGIIVGRKGNVGAVHFSDRGFFPIDTVFYVVSELPLTFLFFLLRTMNFINNDAAVPGLNRNQAYSNQLFYPGSDLITKFAKVADPIFDTKHQIHAQNENLTRTRDLLLPRLISGKLSVEELEIQFPTSMEDDINTKESA